MLVSNFDFELQGKWDVVNYWFVKITNLPVRVTRRKR